MKIGPDYSSPLISIQRAMAKVSERSADLASADHLRGEAPVRETADALVDIHNARQQVQAAAKVMEANNEMIGTLLDIEA